MKNRITYFLIGSLPASIIAPMLAFAQNPPTVPPTPTALQNLNAFRTFICLVIFGWFFTFLIVLAAIFALVAAYKYLTAGGDPEKVKSASNVLIYAAIAVVAALFARGLPLLVSSLIGGAVTSGSAAGNVAC